MAWNAGNFAWYFALVWLSLQCGLDATRREWLKAIPKGNQSWEKDGLAKGLGFGGQR